jgi:hypothetical protein
MKKMGCAQCGGAKMKKGGAKKVGCPPNCSDVDKKNILRTTSSKVAAGIMGAAAGIGSAVGATKAAKKMKAIKEIRDKAKKEGKSITRKEAKATYNKPKALPEERKGGAIKKMQTGGVPKRNISKPGAGFAAETKGGSNLGMNIYGIPNAGQTGPNRKVTTETMQAGGNFAPNRAVQSSCKNGMVRDENGRCVMVRKAQSGGSLKAVDKSKNPGLAKLPTPVRNKMGYAKKGGVKKR